MSPSPPRSTHFALLSFLVLATAFAGGPGAASTERAQGAVRKDWWPRIESNAETLATRKWKRALDHADRIADEVQRDAWSGRDLDRVMAELAFQQAMAELNLGRPDDALWHWYAAINLRPEIAERDLAAYGQGAELAGLRLRRMGDMPEGIETPSALEQLRLEPVAFPSMEPPEVTANAVATLRRQPDVLIEAIVDRQGRIRQPILLTEDAHPVLVYAAFQWLSEMPPARPASLDGRPVDTLELINVSFTIERGGGEVTMPDLDG